MRPYQTILSPLKILAFILVLILLWVLVVPHTFAATGIRRTINFQGKIVNKTSKTNITDGDYSFTFKLYDASSGGTQLPSGSPWSETQTITVTDGIFRAELGSSTVIPTDLDFNSDSLYLDITFDGETFGSRVRMTAVPYAFNAEKVNGLNVTATTGTLTIPNSKTVSFGDAFTTSGANPLTLTTTGTTNATLPTGSITLVDTTTSQSLTNKTIGSTGLTFSGATVDITTGTNENLVINPNGSGNVGIGTTAPGALLEVAGNTIVAGTASLNGNVVIGDANTDKLTINAGSSGSGINFGDSSFATCTALETSGGVLTCGTDDTGVASITLIGDSGSGTVSSALTVLGGTNGVDTIVSGSAVTVNLDTTEIGSTTFGSGSGITWTFDASGGTDPTIAFGSNSVAITAGTATVTGNFGIGTTAPNVQLAVGPANQFQVNSSGAIAAATGISSSGTIAFSGLSTNGYVKTSGGTGTLSVGTTIPSTDVSGTLLSSSADSGTGTYIQGDTLTIVGGTNGIDTSLSGDNFTLNFDSTEVGTTTWGSGSGITWTFDSTSGTDTSIAFGNNQQVFTAGTASFSGRLGIGTTAPTQTLSVNGRIRGDGGLILNQGTAATDNLIYVGSESSGAVNASAGLFVGGIGSSDSGDGPYFLGRGNTFSAISNQRGNFLFVAGNPSTPGATEGSIQFWTGANAAENKIIYTKDGSFGIGTTAPSGRLQAVGDEVRIGSAGTITNATGDGDLYIQDFLEADGSVSLGDAAADTLTITAGSAGSGITLANFTTNGYLKVIGGTGTLSVGTTIPSTDLSGTIHSTSADSGTTSTIIQGDTLGLFGGTNGIDTSVSGDAVTFNLDTTEIGDATFGSGSGSTWTFDSGSGTDPTLGLKSAQMIFTAGTASFSNRLGIGTTAPTEALSVRGSANTNIATFSDGTATGGVFINNSSSTAVQFGATTNHKFGLFANNGSPTLVVNTDGNIGIGANAVASYPLHVLSAVPTTDLGGAIYIGGTATSTTGTTSGVMSAFTILPSGTSTATYFGLSGRPITSSTNLANATIAGVGGFPTYSGVSGTTLGNLVGDYSGIINNNSGTVTNAYGLNIAAAINSGSGVITNNFGGLINAQTAGTNNVGLAIGEATGTKQTNLLIGSTTAPTGSYSIYNASADQNYFAGEVALTTVSGAGLTNCSNATTSKLLWDSTGKVFSCGTDQTGGGGGGWTDGGASVYVTSTSANVGIGTTAPSFKLDILAPNTYGTRVLSGSATGYTAIGIGRTAIEGAIAISGGAGNFSDVSTAGDIVLRSDTEDVIIAARNATGGINFTTGAADTSKMIILNNGSVGIGTTAPGYALQVGNTFAVDTATNSTITVDAARVGRLLDYNDNNYGLDPASTGTALAIAGNAGIGISVPSGRLQVVGDEVRIGSAGTITNATGDGDLYIQDFLEADGSVSLGDAAADTLTITAGSAGSGITLANFTTNGYLKVIGGTGTLSVGTTIPSTDLSGTIHSTSADSGTTSTIIQGDTLSLFGGTNGIDTSVSGDAVTFNLDTTEISDATFGSGSAFTWTFDSGSGTDPTIINRSALQVFTAGTAAFNGRLGIGTTAPTQALDVVGNILVSGSATLNGVTTLGDASADKLIINAGSAGSGVTLTNFTTNGYLKVAGGNGTVSVGTTIPMTDLSGSLIGFSADQSATMISSTGQTVGIQGGTNGIDVSLTGLVHTINFDPTEVGTITWGTGSSTTWTFDSGSGTDPTEIFGSAKQVFTAGTAGFTGRLGIGTTSPAAALDVVGNVLVSASASFNGTTTIGDANTDSLIITSGSSGSGITLSDSSFATCTALTTVSNKLTCGSAGGGTTTLTGDSGSGSYTNTLSVVGGTNGVDTVISGSAVTVNLDTTEIAGTTFASGSGFTWSFDSGAGTDPTEIFGSAKQVFTAGTAGFSGNLGVGTTAPAYVLDVQGTNSSPASWAALQKINYSQTGNSASYNGGVGLWIVSANNVTGAGLSEAYGVNVGIGTSNDGDSQTVIGYSTDVTTYASDGAYHFYATDNNNSGGGSQYGLGVYLNDTDTSKIGAEIGIDTTVSGNTALNVYTNIKDSAGITAYGGYITTTIDNDASESSTGYGLYISADNDDASSTITGLFVDADGDGGGEGTEYAAILMNGLVGIGTTAPTEELHLYNSQNAATKFQVENPTSGGSATAEMQLVGGTGSDRLVFGLGSASYSGLAGMADMGFLYADTGISGLAIWTNGSERMRFNNSGFTGIGTTNPTVTLDVGGDLQLRGQGDVRFADADSSNWVAFQAPTTVSSNVTWTLPNADSSGTQCLASNGSGTLSWGSCSAGSSPWSSSGSNVYLATASNNVGIGTTNPGAKLKITNSSDQNGLVVSGNSTQTTDLVVFENSSGADLFTLNANTNSATLLSNTAPELNATGSTSGSTSTLSGYSNQYQSVGVATNQGYLYGVGGFSFNTLGVAISAVNYAKVNNDGTIGSWTGASTMPGARAGCATIAAQGWLYCIGGYGGAGGTNTVYSAKINQDGTLGTWTTQATTTNTTDWYDGGYAYYNGYIYLVGGYVTGGAVNTVQYARVNADGSLGTFSTTSSLTASGGTGREGNTVLVANGYIYSLGGNNTTTSGTTTTSVQYAKINADGTLGTWTAQGSNLLSSARAYATGATMNGYLYVIGGHDSGGSQTNTIQYAPVTSTGATGAWTTASTTLTATRSTLALGGNITANGYAYIVGGDTTGGNGTNTTYYLGGPRIKLNGNIDLVSGDGGINWAEGGTAGNLSAGNTDIIGDLSVRGDVNVRQNLQAEYFSGAGLTDCNGTTDKLAYNATTNQFECNTDQTGGGSGSTYTYRLASNWTKTTSTAFSDVDNGSGDSMSFPVGTSETWIYQMYSQGNFPTGADAKWDVTAPTGATCVSSFDSVENTLSVANLSCGTTSGTMAVTAGADNFVASGTIVTDSSHSGTVMLQYGQATSSGTSTIYAGSFVLAFQVSGADLAETYYTKDPSIQPGTVVALDGSEAGVRKSSRPYDPAALGVISTKPGMMLGDAAGAGSGGRPVFLALSGRIPVKVSTENGQINPGDYLTSSSVPGVAMKATHAGPVIGQALMGYKNPDPTAVGTTAMFAKQMNVASVALKSAIPGAVEGEATTRLDVGTQILGDLLGKAGALDANTSAPGDTSVIMDDRLVANIEVVSPRVVTDGLEANRIKAATAKDLTLQLSQDGALVVSDSYGAPKVRIDENGNAYFAGTITADKIHANQIEGLKVMAEEIIATSIREQNNLNILKISSQSAGLTPESESSTSAVTRTMAAAPEASPSAAVMPSVFRQIAEFFNKVIFHNDVEFGRHIAVSNDTAGYAIVKKSETFAEVAFEKSYDAAPVVNASLNIPPMTDELYKQMIVSGDCEASSSSQSCQAALTRLMIGEKFAVSSVTPEGFIIQLAEPATTDTRFSWQALAASQPKTASGWSVLGIFGRSANVTPTPEVTETPVAPQASASASIVPLIRELKPTDVPLASIGEPKSTSQTREKVTVLDNPLGFARLRSKPTIDSEELDRIPVGASPVVLDHRDGWHQVSFRGQTGWVSDALVK